MGKVACSLGRGLKTRTTVFEEGVSQPRLPENSRNFSESSVAQASRFRLL